MAAEFWVNPTDRDDQSSISKAIASAAAGDTIHLAPGIYRERLVIDKAIKIKGEPGAILDGSRPLELSWMKAPNDLPGAYVADLDKDQRPYGLLLDGKFIAALRFDRAQQAGEWHWKTLIGQGTPLSRFANIKALWLYHPDEHRIYAHFENDLSPDPSRLTWLSDRGPLVKFSGADSASLENLTLQGGETAIQLDDRTSNCTVAGCKIHSYEGTGILITGNSGHNVIENNEITRGALEDWTPALTHDRSNYEIWRIHKDVGFYDRSGIDLVAAGAGNRIMNNNIYLVFDGICIGDYRAESLSQPLPDPDAGKDTEIAGNTIENVRDSGMEFGVGSVNVHVHHNVLRRTHGGVRFKVPRIGPTFIHHNQLIDGSPFNFWFSMDGSTAEGYVYQNTIVGTHAALNVLFDVPGIKFIAPKWHFVNNLVMTKEGFYQSSDNAPPKDFVEAGNVVTKNGSDPSAVPKDSFKGAVDLSTYWNGKPLPGSEQTLP